MNKLNMFRIFSKKFLRFYIELIDIFKLIIFVKINFV